MQSPIPKVNEYNEIIGETTIKEALENDWPRQTSRVFIIDTNKNILSQKRSQEITGYPGLWDQAAGGHVDIGETPEEAAIRETKEEIGVTADLRLIAAGLKLDSFADRQFTYIFRAICDKQTEFTIDPKDVAELKWFSLEELEAEIQRSPGDFVPSFIDLWQRLRDTLITI